MAYASDSILHIQLLGQFRLVYGDQPVTSIEAPRLQALLAYLLLHRIAPQSRQQLAFLLYPDSSEAQARTNLRNQIHYLRKALPDADRFLISDAQTLQWNSNSAFRLDVVEFEHALAHASSSAALREAVNLYGGELLPGCYDDWILPEREHLRQRFVETLERLILLLENQRDYRAALSYAERLLHQDPLREETYRHLMRLHRLSGDEAGARRVYQTCVKVLQRELDAEPSAETRAEFARLSRRDLLAENDLPSSTITLLFTDIEGSTQLLQRVGERYAGILEEHNRILRAAFARWNGRVVDTQGDSFFVAFARAADAVSAATEAQRALAKQAWGEGVAVRVRMGLHTGEPKRAGERYVGLDVHRAARIGAAGHGGQVLLSQTTRELVERELPVGVSLKDLGEHQLKDLSRAEHIFQIVANDVRSDFPPLKSVQATPNNLPVQLTSFVGREQQITDLKRLLSLQNTESSRPRLVTFTGAGGSGKTRLSIQVGNDLLPSFQDGVWFVDLSPLVDPTLIPQAITSALSVHEQPGRALLDTLLDYLHSKELLLILDNCEQFVSACAALIQTLLEKCPRIQILATSRERLNLAGETVWLVPTLSLPAVDNGDWLGAPHSEAVHLFVERAVSAFPTFVLTRQNAPSVAQICRRLDGIPLAIELAAARVKILTPVQIAARLDDAFHLLTRASYTAVPRQQTLRAAMDWSYELLSAHEQTLFRRLSVFAGGFTLESAEQVCGDDESKADLPPSSLVLSQYEILDLLSDLVDKSLIVVAAWEEEKQVRYRMLEPVRQYAEEKLTKAGELPRARDRHLEYCLRLANEARIAEPAQELVMNNRLAQDHDNLRAALNWAIVQESSEAALELCAGLGAFWETRGFWTESERSFARALMLSRQVQTQERITPRHFELFARVLALRGHRAVLQGDYVLAETCLQESLSSFKSLNDRSGSAIVFFNLGVMAWYKADLESAEALFQEYLAIGQEFDAKPRIAHALWILAISARNRGDMTTARTLSLDSLRRYQELGDRVMSGWLYENLGCIALNEGSLDQAEGLFEQSLAHHQASASEFGFSITLMSKAYLHWYQGSYETAFRLFRETLTRFKTLVTSGPMFALSLTGVAAVTAAGGHAECATELFGAVQAQLDRTGTGPLQEFYGDVFTQALAAVRSQLDQPTFEKEWAKGYALTLHQAVDYALEVMATTS